MKMSEEQRVKMGKLIVLITPIMYALLYTYVLYHQGYTINDFKVTYILVVGTVLLAIVLQIGYLNKIKKRSFDNKKDLVVLTFMAAPSAIAVLYAVFQLSLLLEV